MAFADLVLVDHASGVSAGDLRRFSYALGDQLRDDVAPVWGRYVVPWVGAPEASLSPRVWRLHFWPTADAARRRGALGYHETEGKDYVPVGHVMLDRVRAAGENWTVVASHEALEMVGNEWLNLEVARDMGDGVIELWSREICLTGETLVDLADGTQRPIRDLAEDPRAFSVRTVGSDGRRQTASAVAWRTARDAPVVRVRLSDGRSVRCTPYHKFMLADGSYKAAGRLLPGDSLYSDVTPRPTASNLVDRVDAYAVLRRQIRGRIAALPDGAHRLLREFAVADLLPTQVAVSRHPFLGGGVQQVLSMGSQEEVIRADAPRSVTSVTHFQSLRDLSHQPDKRQAVGVLNTAGVTDLTVAVRVGSALPQPTGARFVYTGPEAALERRGSLIVRGVPTSGGIGGTRALFSTEVRGTQAVCEVGTRASLDRAGSGHALVVDAVQPDGKADVYDLHVPSTHNFSVGGGIYVHNCDAVQGLAYRVAGVLVSNFVYPEWFISGSDGPFDHLRHLSRPFEVHASGYASVRRIERGVVTRKNVYGAMCPQRAKKREWLTRRARRT